MAKLGLISPLEWKIFYCNIEYTGDDSDYVYGIILYLTQKELEAVNRREGYISDNNPENSYHRHVHTGNTHRNEDVFVTLLIRYKLLRLI